MVPKQIHHLLPRPDHPRTLVPNPTRSVPPSHFLCPTTTNNTRTGILVRAKWVPGVGCVLTSTHNTILAATFIYSMVFDFVVLLLNVYKLGRFSSVRVLRRKGEKAGEETMLAAVISAMGSGKLANMIFNDGIIYFIIACVFFLYSISTLMLTHFLATY